MGLFSETMHRLSHAVEEEPFRFVLTAVSIWGGHQFLGLWRRKGCKEVREERSKRPS
jgi:hypothetical protein